MTTIVYDLPRPPEGEQWCTGCVMLLRGKLDQQNAEEVKRLAADEHPDAVKIYRPKLAAPYILREAVVRAPFHMMPDMGILDLCWTCAAGVAPVQRSALAMPNGLPPGLIRGQG